MDLHALRYGVEIETVRRTREQVVTAIQGVVGGCIRHVGTPTAFDPWELSDDQGRVWKVVADASLTTVAADLRAEIVSPVLAYVDIPVLQDVVRAVRHVGARAESNCGIHIHVDASAFDGRALANLARVIYKQEALILPALGITPERLARYTRPINPDLIRRLEQQRPRTREELNRIWYGHHNASPAHYDQSRYHGVNLHSVFYRGTIEFRWFQGTLHAGKVKAYVQLVLAITARATTQRAASSRRRAYDQASARYDFRCFLLRLGMIGAEFATARRHLLSHLPGDSAFKRGRPPAKGSTPGKDVRE